MPRAGKGEGGRGGVLGLFETEKERDSEGLAECKTDRQFDHGLGPRARTLVTVAGDGNEETGVHGGDAGTASYRFFLFFSFWCGATEGGCRG